MNPRDRDFCLQASITMACIGACLFLLLRWLA